MELLQFPSFSVLFTFLFFFTIAVLKISSKPNKPKLNNLPPGPWKLPLIGNLHQLLTSSPHHTLRDLSNEYGPLMQLQLGEVPTIVVSSARVAEQVLKTNDLIFSQRPHVLACEIMAYNCKAVIFTPYGNYWKHMRKIITMELLSPTRVQSFRTIREEEVADFIKSIALNIEGSVINLSEKIFSLSYGITARAAFGKKSKGQNEFISIIKETAKISGAFCLADMYPSSRAARLVSRTRIRAEKLHQASDGILENIVNEHKEKRNKIDHQGVETDLVDVLLQLQQQGDLEFPLGNESIKAVMKDMFAAGSETSATTIEWAMSELLKNPKLMKKAQDEVRTVFGENVTSLNEEKIHELKFIRLIVKETLRLHPPALLILRQCGENCVINGYDVAAKTKVLINVWAIQRDPSNWNHADEFRPERFYENSIDFRGNNLEYIPFGAGRRICPGVSFGIPSIELPLANLLYYFDWKHPNGMKFEDMEMRESFGLTARRRDDLLLIPIPYYSLK